MRSSSLAALRAARRSSLAEFGQAAFAKLLVSSKAHYENLNILNEFSTAANNVLKPLKERACFGISVQQFAGRGPSKSELPTGSLLAYFRHPT